MITLFPSQRGFKATALEHLAAARDQATWQQLMEPALAGLNCRVIQSTSDEAPGLLAYVAHHLGAHHSPDVFQGQHERVKAVSGPMATKQRAAAQAATNDMDKNNFSDCLSRSILATE